MCGQGGCCGSLDFRSEKAFQKLLIFNSVRGTDSTGAASVKRAPEKDGSLNIVVAKEVGHPFNLLQIRRKNEHDFTDVLSGTHRVLMGHCRASTRGASTRFNAHPFCFDHIVGTHNGTIGYSSHSKLEGHRKFDTDSEAIYNEIEAHGIGDTVKKLKGYKDPKSIVTCEDAYALVWFDSQDNSINFLRNKERPLCFAFSKDKQQLFWSSEDVHLSAAMSDIPHEDKYIYYLPIDEHYSWVIPNHNQAFGKPKVVRREGHKETPFWERSHHGGATGSTQIGGTSTPTNSNYSTTNYSTSRSQYKDEHGDARIGWPSREFKPLWEKYNQTRNMYRYGSTDHGIFYDTPQECWDNIADGKQLQMVIAREVPHGVNSGYIYDENQAMHVKVPSAKKEAVTVHKPVSQSNKYFDEIKETRLKGLTDKEEKVFQVYKDQNRRVYWDTNNKHFTQFTFMGMHCDPPWDRMTFKTVPEAIPFTMLDINARHNFKHIGSGKRKVTYYKGFKNEMLVRQVFEERMKTGCAGCKRSPEWGNEVQFVTNDIFVCEFCSKDTEVVNQWKALAEELSKEKSNTTI